MTDKVVFVFERSGRFNSAPVSGGAVYEGTKGEEVDMNAQHAVHMARSGYGRILGARETKVVTAPEVQAETDAPAAEEAKPKPGRQTGRRGRQR